MKLCSISIWITAGVFFAAMSGALLAGGDKGETSAADDVSKQVTKEQREAEKADQKKKCEADLTQRHLEKVRKEIEECQKAIQALKEKMTDPDLAAFKQKKLDFLNKQVDLLNKVAAALESQNVAQAKTLEEQRQEESWAWNGYGEMAARLEAERVKWGAKMKDLSTPEIQAAWSELNQASDQLLMKLKEKQTLEKDLKTLKARQQELFSRLEKLLCAAKSKAQKQEKPTSSGAKK